MIKLVVAAFIVLLFVSNGICWDCKDQPDLCEKIRTKMESFEKLVKDKNYKEAGKLMVEIEHGKPFPYSPEFTSFGHSFVRSLPWDFGMVYIRNFEYDKNIVNGKLGRVKELLETASFSITNSVFSKTEKQGSGACWNFRIRDKTGSNIEKYYEFSGGCNDESPYFLYKG